MNIFVVDQDPKKAAQMLCDQHVVKMTLETAQMLCTVAKQLGFDVPYKSSHKKHPCTLWAGETQGNWNWLVEHGLALGEEYTARYGKHHKSHAVIKKCKNLGVCLPKGRTPFVQAMNPEFKDIDPVKAYRNYYKSKTFSRWKYTQKPSWLTQDFQACTEFESRGGRL